MDTPAAVVNVSLLFRPCGYLQRVQSRPRTTWPTAQNMDLPGSHHFLATWTEQQVHIPKCPFHLWRTNVCLTVQTKQGGWWTTVISREFFLQLHVKLILDKHYIYIKSKNLLTVWEWFKLCDAKTRTLMGTNNSNFPAVLSFAGAWQPNNQSQISAGR